jgi:hypothetical protein
MLLVELDWLQEAEPVSVLTIDTFLQRPKGEPEWLKP